MQMRNGTRLALRVTTEKSGEFPIRKVDAFMEGQFQPKAIQEKPGNSVPEIKQEDEFAPFSFPSDWHL